MRTLRSVSTRTSHLVLFFLLALSGFVVTAEDAVAGGDSSVTEGSAPAETPSGTDATATAPTPAAECPINCANGAECKLGTHNFDFFPREANDSTFTFLQTTSREGWYCDCPAGFTGLRCNRKYEICPLSMDMNSSMDAHFCFHGGTCLEGLTDGTHDSIAEFQRFCDCKDANHNGTPYFGKYCEIEGAVRCSEDSDEYCTAQGECKPDFEDKFYPCECRVGHRGPHCEFMRGSVPECTKKCGGSDQGGQGQCRLGIKEFENARYEDFWAGHDENYQYCECENGWFGDECETPGVKCGGAHCFNGGACLESLNNNGEKTYACDCRNAGHLGLSWAGQYCENAETSNCNGGVDGTLQHANGHLFCTNGGTCKDPNNPHLGCDCPNDQYGPSCEFHKAEDATCSLKCQNGGECRQGMKDNSLLDKLGQGVDGFDEAHSELYEHCVCPHNFFGIQCEHKLEICDGGDHVCLHGSQCVVNNEGGEGEVHHTCDCDSAFDSFQKYAGKFCQYSSTDICTKNGQPGMGKANFAFCVNNGMCKGKVEDGEDPPGCDCPEGFYGDHCEYLEAEKEQDEGKFDGGYDDDVDYAGADDYFKNVPVPVQTTKYGLNRQGVVVGLSAAVIVIVLVFIGVIVRALIKGRSDVDVTANVKEFHSGESAATSPASSGIVHSNSGDSSLEDIEVDDYVNNHSNVLTDSEMTNVQIV